MPLTGRLDRHAGVHQRERRAADRAHRRGAVRLERLRDEPDRVREVVGRRDHRLERPLRERAVADVAALRAAHEARLPDRVGREVVVVHVAALGLEREVVDPLPLLGGAEREQRHDLRLAAREERRAVRARRDADLAVDRADLLGAATVGPALVDRDLLADELLVDRLGGLLDELLRQRVLDDGRRRRRPAPGPTGNGSSTPSMIRSKSSWRFADLSSFESCSASVSARRSSSNCSRTGPLDGLERVPSRGSSRG